MKKEQKNIGVKKKKAEITLTGIVLRDLRKYRENKSKQYCFFLLSKDLEICSALFFEKNGFQI